jgi:hypothetical protein
MTIEVPRCARCRTTIHVDQRVIFRRDGRVGHVDCPPVTCPVCEKPIVPGQPIRRGDDGEQLLHANCWIRCYRQTIRVVSRSP